MYRARIILLVNKDSHSIVKRTTKETCVAHKTCNFSIAFKRLNHLNLTFDLVTSKVYRCVS